MKPKILGKIGNHGILFPIYVVNFVYDVVALPCLSRRHVLCLFFDQPTPHLSDPSRFYRPYIPLEESYAIGIKFVQCYVSRRLMLTPIARRTSLQ